MLFCKTQKHNCYNVAAKIFFALIIWCTIGSSTFDASLTHGCFVQNPVVILQKICDWLMSCDIWTRGVPNFFARSQRHSAENKFMINFFLCQQFKFNKFIPLTYAAAPKFSDKISFQICYVNILHKMPFSSNNSFVARSHPLLAETASLGVARLELTLLPTVLEKKQCKRNAGICKIPMAFCKKWTFHLVHFFLQNQAAQNNNLDLMHWRQQDLNTISYHFSWAAALKAPSTISKGLSHGTLAANNLAAAS